MLKRIILGLMLTGYCLSPGAQEASDSDRDPHYVTDELRLSLYAQANDRSQVLKLLQSGDLLEIEQIQGAYALVTTVEGTRGWVKRGFLVDEPTSNILLQQEREKNEKLSAEAEKFANSKVVVDQYEKDLDEMALQVQGLENEKQQAAETIAALEREVETRQRELDSRSEDGLPALKFLGETALRYWQYVSAACLVIVLVTFLISKKVIEARIKSRFHGVKIW